MWLAFINCRRALPAVIATTTALAGCRGLLDLDNRRFDGPLDGYSHDGDANGGDTGEGGEGAVGSYAKTAVGVLPVGGDELGFDCPEGSDLVVITLDDENPTPEQGNCSDKSDFLAPGEAKRPAVCSQAERNTTLSFCKVDGRAFHHMTTDVSDSLQHYAVLLLGAVCPNGSVEMQRYITTDADGPGAMSSGDIRPNVIASIRTVLVFCYFRGGPSTMNAFPDFGGLPYAVFHDFDGFQPDWVLRKAWLQSDNENEQKSKGTVYVVEGADGRGEVGSGPEVTDFDRIIETHGTDTIFDLSKVH